MKIRLTKSVILSLSLLLALTALSSCGKNKDVKSNPPTAQTVPAPTSDAQQNPPPQPGEGNRLTPAPGTTVGPNNTLPQTTQPVPPSNGLPQTQPTTPAQNQNPEVLPDLPPVVSGPNASMNNANSGSANDNDAGNRNGRGGQVTLPTPDQIPGTPLPHPGELPTIDQMLASQGSLRANQVDFSKAVPVKTGGQMGELQYTSVGSDALVEEFKQYNAKVAQQQQTFNTNLAKSIVNAKFSRGTYDGQSSLTLTVDEFGTLQTYKLNASSDGDKLNLSLSKTGTTGTMEFQGGFVKCVDQDGGCDTAYAKIKIAGGYTRVIFRNVEADLHFMIQEKISGNAAFSTMENYISNAVANNGQPNSIEGMKVSSFEVINGRSGAGAMMTTLDHQVIGFNVPMLVGAVGANVNVSVAKNADLSKNYDLVNLTKSYSVELSRSIPEVRLVKNDGRGHFKLQLMYGTETNPASIWMVVAGMPKQILSLEQIRSFESQLKAF